MSSRTYHPFIYSRAYSNLSSLSGFDPNFCYGDMLISFVWNGGSNKGLLYADSSASTSTKKHKLKEASPSVDVQPTKQHEFARKHFNRTTQCDFCGKKVSEVACVSPVGGSGFNQGLLVRLSFLTIPDLVKGCCAVYRLPNVLPQEMHK